MKRKFVPVLLALALVVVAIFLRGKGRLTDKPEETVIQLFDAARRGDVPAYLSLLAEPLKTELQTAGAQRGGSASPGNLSESVAGVKGFAVTRSSEPALQGVALDVELVFADRNEKQRFVLVQEQGGWLVSSIGKADVQKPDFAYGTPVFGELGGPDSAAPASRPRVSPDEDIVEPTE